MPEFPEPVLDVETIRRIAGEDVMLPLSPAELDAIRSVLNPLIGEIRQVTLRERAGAEPEVSIGVEEWPA
jgi:hypothetical protein